MLLRLSPSRLNALLHFSVLLMSLMALWINNLFDLPLKCALSLCIALSIGTSLYRRVLLRHARSIVLLVFDGRRWRLRYRDGSLVNVIEQKPLYVGAWFIIVLLRADAGPMPVVIARDSIREDTYRRCLVYFRFSRSDTILS